MKRLTATLCLTIAVLLASAGTGYALPPCPGSPLEITSEQDVSDWHNCEGSVTFSSSAPRSPKGLVLAGFHYTGAFVNGKPFGHGSYIFPNGNKYVGEGKNGVRHGQGTYTFNDGRVMEGIWKNGKFLYANKASPVIRETPKSTPAKKSTDLQDKMEGLKKTCLELGFKKDTEKFGNCVLKLMEDA